MTTVHISNLGHTWILDLDGTFVKHNGYKFDGQDKFLEGAEIFLKNLPQKDMIIFVTSRTDDDRELTERFLREHNIRYDYIIFNAPFGERILINDNKPSGLKTSIAITTQRDVFTSTLFVVDKEL
jgi:23S rRNA G2445 N2-methylase RlmL